MILVVFSQLGIESNRKSRVQWIPMSLPLLVSVLPLFSRTSPTSPLPDAHLSLSPPPLLPPLNSSPPPNMHLPPPPSTAAPTNHLPPPQPRNSRPSNWSSLSPPVRPKSTRSAPSNPSPSLSQSGSTFSSKILIPVAATSLPRMLPLPLPTASETAPR